MRDCLENVVPNVFILGGIKSSLSLCRQLLKGRPSSRNILQSSLDIILLGSGLWDPGPSYSYNMLDPSDREVTEDGGGT